jgi:hypothetical protein
MAIAVLEEGVSAWRPRLPERIAQEFPLEISDSPASLRRDDITVAAVALGLDEVEKASRHQSASAKKSVEA